MDLKQYKVKIREQLLNGMKDQAKRDKALAEGDYVTGGQMNINQLHKQQAANKIRYEKVNALIGGGVRPGSHYKIPKDHYDNLLRQMSLYTGPTISMPGHVTTGHETGGNACESDSDSDAEGGSFVGKKLRPKAVMRSKIENTAEQLVHGGKFHFAKSMDKFGKDLGDGLKKAGISAVSKEVADQGVKFAKKNIGKLMTGAEDVLPEALPVAEEAAPLLLAAGMKKPKRTRRVSEKESKRHELVRKLMKEHDCSLAEASSHIKKNSIPY